MIRALLLALLILPLRCFATPCPVTVGTLTLVCTAPRTTGISPLLVFVDCTGSTDSALTNKSAYPNYPSSTDNPFQHVYYAVNFGDPNASGTGTWLYGSNPGNNIRNLATGPLTSHLYVTTADTTYSAKIDAADGHGNTASCQLSFTAYSQTGSNGFSAANTSCASPSGNFTGCPAGANHLTTGSVATASTATNWASGKLLLLHCGESYSGNLGTRTITTARLDVYGGCQDTQINRPIVTGGATFALNSPSTDIAVSNIDLETSGNTANAFQIGANAYPPAITQATLYNDEANGYNENYYWGYPIQSGMVQTQAMTMGVHQGTYFNLVGNGCINGNNTYDCGGTGTPLFQGCAAGAQDSNLTPLYYVPYYFAVIGSYFNGTGTVNNGQGIETSRSGGVHCSFFSNNTFTTANNIGAVFKFQCSGGHNTQSPSSGSVCSVTVVEDNFLTGEAGGQLYEYAPQNNVTDERMQLGIVERNFIKTSAGSGNPEMLLDAAFVSVRNNVFDNTFRGGTNLQACRRGVSWVLNGTTYPNFPGFLDIYNNTTVNGGIALVSGAPCNGASSQPATNSFLQNTLSYTGGGSSATAGFNNTVSNNTTTTSNNPSFQNASGLFKFLSDYLPQANYTGALFTVPNFFDGCAFAWASQYTLGAISQVCP